jgi:multidrug efflux pump subunit AcrB
LAPDFYGRTLRVVLRYQAITLLVALSTLVLTIFLYIIIHKGFFPVQNAGVIQGISQAQQSTGPSPARYTANLPGTNYRAAQLHELRAHGR